MQIKLGCDPEAFLKDVNGQLKSSIGKIGGSKTFPMPLPLGEGFFVQEDNVALEFNIPPAEGRSSFVESICHTLNFLTDVVKKQYGYTLSNSSAEYFPKEELQHPAALEFGCDPDYNAWTKKRNPRPKATDATLRSCGGHVHVGYDKNIIDPTAVIKMMDLYLGIPSLLMDKGEVRKQLYGGPGAYREKPYGVEYRTLSNFWIFNNRLIEWVWDNTSRAVAAAEQFTLSDEDGENIVNAIKNNDKELATHLVNKFDLEVVYV